MSRIPRSRTWRWLFVWLMSVAALAGMSSCSESKPRVTTRNILLVTVDTLRADHVGAYGYERATTPQLDRFFSHGRIYLDAHATAAYTPPSIVSMLSGLLPPEHRVRAFFQLVDDDIQLICDLLPEPYETAAFVSSTVLTDEAMGIADCFDHFDDFVDESEGPHRVIYERSARRTTDAASQWLRERSDPCRPLLTWVHYMDPHGPYQPPDDASVDFQHTGKKEFDLEKMAAFMRFNFNDGLEYVDRYDEEIAYVDEQIGRLFEVWSDVSTMEDDLVVFSSDHGESMMDHEHYFGHGFNVWEGLIRIPLMIRGPGIEPARSKESVSLIDILPTILAFAGVDPLGPHRGVDLRSKRAASSRMEGGERMIYAEAHRWATVLQGQRKWVVQYPLKVSDPLKKYYYDLAADPEEMRPGDWGETDEGAAWLIELAEGDPVRALERPEIRKGVQLRAPKVAPRITDEQLEKLRGLGYVE